MALAFASSARAEQLQVTEDQTKVLRLGAPVSEMIIGNPSIADAVLLHRNLLAVTGKTFGTTNLILRGQSGLIILDATVHVQPADGPVVTLRKGTESSRYVCRGRCQAMVLQSWSKEFKQTMPSHAGIESAYPCDSPDQIAADGSVCGGRSAYDRLGGRKGLPPADLRMTLSD